MLSQGRVCINGKPCNVAARQVRPGDALEIGPRRAAVKLPGGLEILFEDGDLLIIQKPSGLLTVATEDEREQTVYFHLRQYLQDRNRRQKLFIVHRLDKFASGVLVFAKSAKVQEMLQGIFSRHEIQRKYWAIVEGNVAKSRGTIRSRLVEDKSLRMHSTNDERRGKQAVTHFKVIRRSPKVSTLEVTLETGRKNQIRAHLSEMGHPIAGDRAYGSSQNPLGRLGLHAFLLGFTHPVTGESMVFQTEPPPEFRKYLPE
jgi:23S rRNA pseudouridine1911/1915/1917 synthase